MNCWDLYVECVFNYISFFILDIRFIIFTKGQELLELCCKMGRIFFSCPTLFKLCKNPKHRNLFPNVSQGIDTKKKFLLVSVYTSLFLLKNINMSTDKTEMTVISQEQNSCSSHRRSSFEIKVFFICQVCRLILFSLRKCSLS